MTSLPFSHRLDQGELCPCSTCAEKQVQRDRSGKLKLPVPPAEWFQGVVDYHGLAVESLDWDVCTAAVELPPVHRDPCDRFIIATAKKRHLPVVTGDAVFSSYGIEVVS